MLIEQYRHTARARWQAEQQQREARRAQAWELAQQAAALLKERFGAQRVEEPSDAATVQGAAPQE
ncbi:MAG: hypothetical protein ACJ8CR_29165 [Roseiflexaceae bacterium]